MNHKQDDSYWYSKLSVAQDCAARYKYQFIDKIEVEGIASADIEFGSAFHLGIEAFFAGEDGISTFTVYWDSVKDKGMQYSRFDHTALKQIGLKLLSNFERLHLKHLKPVHNEERLMGTIGKYKFEGTPDFIGTYKGVPTILDFKTSAKEYPKDRILIDDQLYGYAHLAKQVYGFEAQKLMYMVFIKQEQRIQTSCTIDLTQHKLNVMLSNIELQIRSLEERTVWPPNGRNCMKYGNRCPYFDLCFPSGENQCKPKQ